MTFTIKYKQEDNINFNTAETYADEVVRYGKDYNYENAQKAIGKQPVYTVTFSDNKTGVKGEADLISTIGFTTPAALFCGGAVHMQKYAWATEESIEVTAGSGTPAVATASNSASITIETVKESTTFLGTTTLTAAAAAGATTLTVASTANFTIPGADPRRQQARHLHGQGRHAFHRVHAASPPPPSGPFVNITSGTRSYTAVNPTNTNNYAVNSSYLHQRVYRPSEVRGVEGRRAVQPGAGQRAHPARRRRPARRPRPPPTPPPAAAAPAPRRRTRCSVSTTGARTVRPRCTTSPSPSRELPRSAT